MIFLGIDGGGSKTAFALEDENGRELDRVETGPSNWMSTNSEEARQNIAAGIARLKQLPQVVCGGFAGSGRPEGARFFRNCLTGLLPDAQVLVETDAFISCIGAIGMEPGILVIAGTGSIAIGRRANGTMIRVGGWGPIFSDEGSGFWIGREAISTALRANDSSSSGAAREFVSSICQALELESIDQVSTLWKSGSLSVRTVASLVPLLFRQYPAEPANRILNEAAKHLCTMAESAILQVSIPDCRRSISGSIGSQPLMQKLMGQQSGIEFEPPRHSPEHGAIIWARSQVRH